MTDVLEYLALGILCTSAVLALLRVGRAGSIPDKVLGADTLLLILASSIAAGAGIARDTTYLDALVVVTMLSFGGTITVARFIERRGARV